MNDHWWEGLICFKCSLNRANNHSRNTGQSNKTFSGSSVTKVCVVNEQQMDLNISSFFCLILCIINEWEQPWSLKLRLLAVDLSDTQHEGLCNYEGVGCQSVCIMWQDVLSVIWHSGVKKHGMGPAQVATHHLHMSYIA